LIIILLEAGADINAKDDLGWTPLVWALRRTPEVITILLNAGADINSQDKLGQTPLINAARTSQNPEVVTILLRAGADAKAKDNAGKTAFNYAKDNKKLRGTAAYWQLNEAQY
jgi:ankyrin repeat protein